MAGTLTLETKMQVPGEFCVLRCNMPSFVGDWRQMDYGDPQSPRMAQLREEFGLEDVVGGCQTEWEAILALKRWVRSRWNHGWSRAFERVKDGLDILREAAAGEQFTCGHYTTVLVDCARALGIPARPVALAIRDCEFPRDYNLSNVGHCVAEVWCNELGKWVVLDPDLNIHFERDGVPLSALEVHDAWLSGQVGVPSPDDARGQQQGAASTGPVTGPSDRNQASALEVNQITVQQDEPGFVVPRGEQLRIVDDLYPGSEPFDDEAARLTCQRFVRHQSVDYYARVVVAGWEWLAPRCLPTFVGHFAPRGGLRWTSNPADMYWSLNQVRIAATPSWSDGRGQLAICLEHCAPFFSHFERRVDHGPWERCEAAFDWPLHEGTNLLECRTVNVRGRPGIRALLEVAYAHARW